MCLNFSSSSSIWSRKPVEVGRSQRRLENDGEFGRSRGQPYACKDPAVLAARGRRAAGTTGPAGRLFLTTSWGQPAATTRALVRWRQRSRISHRHAVSGLAARGVRAWCWSFFCWLPLSHGLAQVCLHQGGTFRCAATPCTSARTRMLRLPHSAVPWQVVASLQRLSHESILSIPSLSH